MSSIPIYIINVKIRSERRAHIIGQFNGKENFTPKIVYAIPNDHPNVSLWLTIKSIIEKGLKTSSEYIIFCEDDHIFTSEYNFDLLNKCIKKGFQIAADIMFGGVSWFNNATVVDENLFWVEKSSGLQFTIVYKRFYQLLLSASFLASNAADTVIAGLTDRKYMIYPFISTQKEFGYSDLTPSNNKLGRVTKLFDQSIVKCNAIKMLNAIYCRENKLQNYRNCQGSLLDFSIMAIICCEESLINRKILQRKFNKAQEFRISFLSKKVNGRRNIINDLKEAVQIAIDANEDLFAFIDPNIELSPNFDLNYLYTNIMNVGNIGGDMLLGNLADFDLVVPISRQLLWVNAFSTSQFIIFFKPSFKRIQELKNTGTKPLALSSLSLSKFISYPFLAKEPIPKNKFKLNEHNYSLSKVSNKLPEERIKLTIENSLHINK